MQRFIMAATLLLALGLGLSIDRSTSAQDSFTCDDFSTFDEAFDAFVGAGGPQEDPNGVDPDRDGFPCEDLDGTPVDAQSAASNEYPSGTGTFVGSGAAGQESTALDNWIVGSESASNGSDDVTAVVDDTFVGSAAQSDDDEEPTGIGPLVGTAGQSDDGAETDGIGTLVGGEGAWSDGSTSNESVAAMPSTGVGSTGTVFSGLTMGLIALFSVLALGAGSFGLVRARRN